MQNAKKIGDDIANCELIIQIVKHRLNENPVLLRFPVEESSLANAHRFDRILDSRTESRGRVDLVRIAEEEARGANTARAQSVESERAGQREEQRGSETGAETSSETVTDALATESAIRSDQVSISR